MIRTFIAISVPERVKNNIEELQRQLKRGGGHLKWIRTESIHLTLKFLGDVEESKIDTIADSVHKAVSSQQPFIISVSGTGAFPNIKRPRVLWAGIDEGKEILTSLATGIDRACTALGFKPEKRKFSAHLTIGRVKSSKNIQNTLNTMNSTDFEGGSFRAEEIQIIKSELRPEGAKYTPLHTIKLEG